MPDSHTIAVIRLPSSFTPLPGVRSSRSEYTTGTFASASIAFRIVSATFGSNVHMASSAGRYSLYCSAFSWTHAAGSS